MYAKRLWESPKNNLRKFIAKLRMRIKWDIFQYYLNVFLKIKFDLKNNILGKYKSVLKTFLLENYINVFLTLNFDIYQ